MKYQLPQRLQKLVPYQPIQGDYEIRLDANESYFNLKPEQLALVEEKLCTVSYHRYPDPYAEEVCRVYATLYGVRPEAIVAGNGSDELIGILAGTFFDTGDRVAVFEQDFSMYRLYMELYGVSCVTLPKRADLTIDVDETLRAIQEQGITALIFSNPCNPTSLGLSRKEVLRLIEGTDALVILDEAYMDFWDQSLLDVAEQYDNLIILKTCSKAIGLAGIRLGLAISNPTLVRCMKAAKAPYNVNRLTQAFAEVLLQDAEYLQSAADTLVQETNNLYQGIEKLAKEYSAIGVIYKPCTNFVFFEVEHAKELYEALLAESITVRLMGNHLRVSTGSPAENKCFLQALELILKRRNAQ